MFGWSADELIGQPGEVMYPSRESYEALGQIAVPILSAGRQLDLEWELRRKDGSTFLCRMIAKALDAGNTQRGTVWIVEDVTERRRADERAQRAAAEQEAEARVQQALDALERKVAERTAELEDAKARAQHLAGHDALTGLPNRRVLEDRLSQALALSYRNRQQTAVMFIDLDRFKTINDSLGPGVGYPLLQAVAQRLA